MKLHVVSNEVPAELFEGLTPNQEKRAREGFEWAKRFGLVDLSRYNLRTALTLSIIVEVAKREVG